MHQARTAPLLLVLAGAALLGAWFSLETGSVSLSILDAIQQPESLNAQIFWQLRWPRTATAFVTGALLGVAGALMQVLLRNPLADPYILGVSGGASVGALLAILAGAGTLLLQRSGEAARYRRAGKEVHGPAGRCKKLRRERCNAGLERAQGCAMSVQTHVVHGLMPLYFRCRVETSVVVLTTAAIMRTNGNCMLLCTTGGEVCA